MTQPIHNSNQQPASAGSFWDENAHSPWTFTWIVKETVLCLAERRLPKRFLVRKLVSPFWYARLRKRNRSTPKIQVGFGPVIEGQYNIGVRGSRIDPIVDCINATNPHYAADIFFDFEEMDRFDVIVMVKEFHPGLYPQIERLKSAGKVFVYDIVDNPFCTDPRSVSYHDHPEFLRLMDGVIASSPIQSDDVRPINANVVFIEHPIINFEVSTYPKKDTVDIVWQGYMANVQAMFRLHKILGRIRQDTEQPIRMIYHSNCPSHTDGMFHYVKWKIRDWQKMLAQADIGIVIKPPDDDVQRRKPSNKVLSYMAAGLPVVCTPTEADKLILEHGKTGFFAYTDDDWYACLKQLIEDADLRESMGRAGYAVVSQEFTLAKMTAKYTALFDTIREHEGQTL